MNGFLTTAQLREKYGVSRQAIFNWRRLGLQSVRLDGRTVIFNEYETHQWLLKNMANRRGIGVIK